MSNINKGQSELKRVNAFLFTNTATARMVYKALNIDRANITRYKRQLEISGRLWVVKFDYCKDSGCRAGYLSTNPKYNDTNQLGLFDEEGND